MIIPEVKGKTQKQRMIVYSFALHNCTSTHGQ